MDGETVENVSLRLTTMDALTTIQRVSHQLSAVGLRDAPQCRDWGIADSDQPIQTYNGEN
jgi:hypothetical protein